MFVLDSHCDTPSQILRLRDLSIDNHHSHVDFPKLRRGAVDGAFFALYIPASYDYDAAYGHALRLIEGVRRTVRRNSDRAAFALSSHDAYSNKEKGLFSVFMGLENGSAIGEDLKRLDYFYAEGVRYVTLCHSRNNQICDSCAEQTPRWGGLSPFGKQLVVRMNSSGMLIDVSHISDQSFYDVLEYSTRPVAATHSCCRAMADHPRNLSDHMIRKMAEAGGVVQISFYPVFLDASFADVLLRSGLIDRGEQIEKQFIESPWDADRRAAWNSIQDELQSLSRPSFRLIAEHIDHVVGLVGIEHVGIGSDFDGIEVTPDGMEDISMLPVLFDELESRGYSSEDIAKIAGGNFLRILG